MNHQLALAIQLQSQANLTSFCWGKNLVLKHAIEATFSGQGERFFYIWGHSGAGKSHLLQGICQLFIEENKPAIYLPLSLLKEWGPESIEGLLDYSLIALDDIDEISHRAGWEHALFDLYNQVNENGKATLITSNVTSPAQSSIALPDLRSRFNWGLVIQLKELDDEGKLAALQIEAKKRGFHLPQSVGLYLIHRCARNMNDLQLILEKLDRESLAAKRKITIPFIKSVLTI